MAYVVKKKKQKVINQTTTTSLSLSLSLSLIAYDKLKLKIACSNVETSDLKAYGTFEVFLMNYSTQQTKLNTAGKISGTCQHNCGQDDVDQEFQVSENVGDVYLGKLCSFISYPSSFQCTFVAKGFKLIL